LFAKSPAANAEAEVENATTTIAMIYIVAAICTRSSTLRDQTPIIMLTVE
jgi:hypothetical protein